MDLKELKEIVANHTLWEENPETGARADLSNADLRNAQLSNADLRNAQLSGAKLSGADLTSANLRGANLSDTDFRNAQLSGAKLSGASLTSANLRGANLSGANLRWADLRGANLRGANLGWADLRGADLSGVEGFDASAWLTEHLEQDDLGLIAYKRIGQTSYPTPAHWEIAPGKFITETVNPDRGTECGSGVNVGTRAWCETHYRGTALWRCRIRWIDLAGVVVPFDTDGKFRASRVELLEVVDK